MQNQILLHTIAKLIAQTYALSTKDVFSSIETQGIDKTLKMASEGTFNQKSYPNLPLA